MRDEDQYAIHNTQYALLIMGPPGAGKGTQAAKISKRYKIPQISTGDMFRAAVASGTELGIKAKACMDSGKLVPDDVTIGIVRDRLSKADCDCGFILDGFPRTVEQAEALNQILSEQGKKLTRVININVPVEYLIERAEGRRICKKCGATYHIKYHPPRSDRCDECGGELYQRTDDTAATMGSRLKVYESSTRPLIEYYKDAGKYSEVDGRQSIEKVTEDLERVLNSVKE